MWAFGVRKGKNKINKYKHVKAKLDILRRKTKQIDNRGEREVAISFLPV